MQITDREPYSWRLDPAIAAFDDSRLVVVMDGDCALCGFGARVLARFDTEDQVRIVTAASPLGSALLKHFGIDPQDPESWLTLHEGRARVSLDGIIASYGPLHWLFWPLLALRGMPVGVQDWLYARIARNRVAWFGRADMCATPDQALKDRLLS